MYFTYYLSRLFRGLALAEVGSCIETLFLPVQSSPLPPTLHADGGCGAQRTIALRALNLQTQLAALAHGIWWRERGCWEVGCLGHSSHCPLPASNPAVSPPSPFPTPPPVKGCFPPTVSTCISGCPFHSGCSSSC